MRTKMPFSCFNFCPQNDATPKTPQGHPVQFNLTCKMEKAFCLKLMAPWNIIFIAVGRRTSGCSWGCSNGVTYKESVSENQLAAFLPDVQYSSPQRQLARSQRSAREVRPFKMTFLMVAMEPLTFSCGRRRTRSRVTSNSQRWAEW